MTDNKELFAKEHDKLFADLEALNEQQIEVGGLDAKHESPVP